jgi:hypothetical protein
MRWWAGLLIFGVLSTAEMRAQDPDFRVYTEHPRLFLRPQRLRMLQREKQRDSQRWRQFALFMAGRAPMPEPGFAEALYLRVGGEADAGKRAVTWALSPAATDLRQLALVFDWCQDALTEAQSQTLAKKLVKNIESSAGDRSIPATRSRLLAAIALADHMQEVSTRTVEQIIRVWWREQMGPALKAGNNVVPRDDLYALFEILHAVRDNLSVDLREAAPLFFKGLPAYDLLSYYPATFPAAEGEYRIPAVKGGREPDLRRAAMARAAELAMVPFDNNSNQTLVLQGWLMHDSFLLRGTFGVTYEFLWANPYQPGLSYYHVPLVFHDDLFGRLFARSSWEENARWLGYFDGELQLFQDGKVALLNPEIAEGPLSLDEAVIYFGRNAQRFTAMIQAGEDAFVVGLKPRAVYQIEVDDEELVEQSTDPGGILALHLPRQVKIGVRIRPRPTAIESHLQTEGEKSR